MKIIVYVNLFYMKKFLLITLFFCSCQKSYLSVQQEWIDQTHLASHFVQSPDPQKENFEQGRKIIIYWSFPARSFDKEHFLLLTVKFWDQSEQKFRYPIHKNKGYTTLFFPEGQKLYTYRIQVLDDQKQIVEDWKHQLWTDTVKIKKL